MQGKLWLVLLKVILIGKTEEKVHLEDLGIDVEYY
jgi:hypothetical protein